MHENTAYVLTVAGNGIDLDSRREISAVLKTLCLNKERISLEEFHGEGGIGGYDPGSEHKSPRCATMDDRIDIRKRKNVRRCCRICNGQKTSVGIHCAQRVFGADRKRSLLCMELHRREHDILIGCRRVEREQRVGNGSNNLLTCCLRHLIDLENSPDGSSRVGV